LQKVISMAILAGGEADRAVLRWTMPPYAPDHEIDG
jgi:hypothetical protein